MPTPDHIAPDAINPSHYRDTPAGIGLECIDYTRGLLFSQGNAAKYAYRAGRKGDVRQDLEKTRWYVVDHMGHHGTGDRVAGHLIATVDPVASRRARLFRYLIAGDLATALTMIDRALATPNLTLADLEWSADA